MKVLPWLIVVGLLVGGFFGNRHYSEQIAQLEHRKAQVDTVYRDRTLTLTKVRHITDSVITHDTVVRAIIATERAACDAVIQTCEQRVAIRDSIIGALNRQNGGFFRRFGCVAGYAATPKGTGVGAACGIRFP